MPPIVDIIIPTVNGLDILKKCILSLYKNTEENFHLIVVDNGSTDGTNEWVKKLQCNDGFFDERHNVNIDLISEKKPLGYAKANNLAIPYCKGKYVLLLNNDTIISNKGWLKAMIKPMEQDKKVGIVGCKLLFPNDLIQHAGVTFEFDPTYNRMVPFHIGRHQKKDNQIFNIEREVPAVTGACMLVRKHILEHGLDEAYVNGGFEDTDLCMRALQHEWKIKYVPVEIYHFESKTMAQTKGWMEHMQENYGIWLNRWNEWVKVDRSKRPDLYNFH